MISGQPADTESADAKRVDEAIEAIGQGLDEEAESLLLSVIANTPSDYSNAVEDGDGTLVIKFWDQLHFVHFVTWQQERGVKKSVRWIGNAYPRAHYYMGFLCVRRRRFDQAIKFLDKGMRLEPTKPHFRFEKAQALVQSGRREEALALYNEVSELGPHVCASDLALARRGRGFVLIELGRLDEAESEFKASMDLEPDSQVARDELRYIDHLRQGGVAAPIGVVSTTSQDVSKCAFCGSKLNKGVVVSLDGKPVGFCKRCHGKLTKKWWQFWK